MESKNLLKAEQKDTLFGNIDDLIPIHQHLFAELEREYDEEDPNFAAVFIDFVNFLFTYYYYLTLHYFYSQLLFSSLIVILIVIYF